MSQSSLAEAGLLPIVSAIVPIYNTDPALIERCIDSLLSQTDDRVEVICIDDGSTAEIARWLDVHCRSRQKARVVHQPNGGVAVARNRGLAEARGRLVCFVDADDFVYPDFIRNAREVLESEQADAVYGSIVIQHSDVSYRWRSLDDEGTRVRTLAGQELAIPRDLALSDSPSPFSDSHMLSATNVVGALFRHDISKDIGFLVGVTQAEDRIFNFEYLGAARRAAFVASDWYAYDHNVPTSATRTVASAGAAKLLPTIRALADIVDRLEDSLDPSSGLLRTAAAVGLMKYLKLLTLLSVDGGMKGTSRTIETALSIAGVSRALDAARVTTAYDRVFLALARRKYVLGLVMIGRLARLRARRRN